MHTIFVFQSLFFIIFGLLETFHSSIFKIHPTFPNFSIYIAVELLNYHNFDIIIQALNTFEDCVQSCINFESERGVALLYLFHQVCCLRFPDFWVP